MHSKSFNTLSLNTIFSWRLQKFLSYEISVSYNQSCLTSARSKACSRACCYKKQIAYLAILFSEKMNTYLTLFSKCLFPSLKQGQCFYFSPLSSNALLGFCFVLLFMTVLGIWSLSKLKKMLKWHLQSVSGSLTCLYHIFIFPSNTSVYH